MVNFKWDNLSPDSFFEFVLRGNPSTTRNRYDIKPHGVFFLPYAKNKVQIFYWRIVKLSATILNDIPQMVFCNQDTFVDVC